MTAATHTAEAPVFKIIPIAAIRPSPQNPRKKMRGLGELTESIKSKGVLHPLLVRPVGESAFEIVAGERRWTAGKAAGLEELPCIVREMAAVTALELALVENMERNDLSPMEEARAFELLMKAYKRTVDDVASKVGRSVGYVRQRLRLTKLIPSAVKLVDGELLDLGGAMVIAQFSEQTQGDIVEKLVGGNATDRITRRDVQEVVAVFSHAISSAPFLTTDAQLVPKAGACTTCPKHTGRQGALFDVIEDADTCLDDVCWGEKARAQFDVQAADFKKRGLRVLTDAEAEKILMGGRPRWDSEYVDARDVRYVGGAQIESGKLAGEGSPRLLAWSEDGARAVELVEKKRVEAAVRAGQAVQAKKASERAATTGDDEGVEQDDDAEREAVAKRKALYERRRVVVCAAAAGQVYSGRVSVDKALRVVIAAMLNADASKVIAKRRGFPIPEDDKKATRDPHTLAVLNAAATSKEPKYLVALLCEMLAARDVSCSPYQVDNGTPETLVGLGLDLKSLGKVAAEELAREKREKKAKTSYAKANASKPKKKSTSAPAKKAKRAA